MEAIPRREYILSQKRELGRRVIGVFPAVYPREMLLAMNILPVEIWDPPVNASLAGAHLQPYICSVVRSGLELVLQGKCKDIDGFLFPHTCDSIQNLASIVNDYLGIEKPCFFIYHPKAPIRESSRQFYVRQLKDLALQLEGHFEKLEPERLRESVLQGEKTRRTIEGLYKARSDGTLNMSNAEFYKLIRQGEYLHPDDYLPLLDSTLSDKRGNCPKGPKIILSGILPNPPEILDYLDELGISIADDDLLCCGRRLLAQPLADTDPFVAMAEVFFSLPPCPTRGSPIGDRFQFLSKKVRETGAKGVIFQIPKFCEPELFDVPLLVDGLKGEGVAALVMDTEINQGLSGQICTRLEAFSEMIR